jgi:hypothetical protein
MQANELVEQVAAMRMGVEYKFAIALRNFKVILRPLADGEVMECYGNVSEYINQIPASRRTKFVEDNAMAREFLKKASSPFEHYAPGITDPMLDQMTTDEIMYLYKEWQAVCDRVNPALENTPMDKLEELVESVKKNPPKDLRYQLTQLSFGHLVSLVHYLLTKND